MISNKMQEEFNNQINAEFWSASFYLSMSAYFEHINLPGFAHWFRVQYREESAHALKFFDYVVERGGRVLLRPVAGVTTEWKSPLDAFEDTYKHELQVTSLINGLVDSAISERDHASNNFLQWYVAEQTEEEAGVDRIVQQLRMIGDNVHALLLLDRELATRIFVDPLATTPAK